MLAVEPVDGNGARSPTSDQPRRSSRHDRTKFVPGRDRFDRFKIGCPSWPLAKRLSRRWWRSAPATFRLLLVALSAVDLILFLAPPHHDIGGERQMLA